MVMCLCVCVCLSSRRICQKTQAKLVAHIKVANNLQSAREKKKKKQLDDRPSCRGRETQS